MVKSMVVGTTNVNYKDVPIIKARNRWKANYPYITISPDSVVILHLDEEFQKRLDDSVFDPPVQQHIGKRVDVSTTRKLITRYEKKEVTNV